MPDDTQTSAKTNNQSVLNIPEDTLKQFGELIEMIKASRSMDDEERQYWVDVLPIMSDEQIQNLKNILDNEQKQIEKAQQAYSAGFQQAAKKAVKEFDETAYLEKKKARLEAEKQHEEEEKGHEEKILEELEEI